MKTKAVVYWASTGLVPIFFLSFFSVMTFLLEPTKTGYVWVGLIVSCLSLIGFVFVAMLFIIIGKRADALDNLDRHMQEYHKAKLEYDKAKHKYNNALLTHFPDETRPG